MDKTVKIDAVSRLAALFDDGVFTQIDSFAKGAQGDTEVVAGFGNVNNVQCYAFAQNSEVNGGAITVAQCSKIKKVYSLAQKTGCPVIGIYDSNGVLLTEGFEVLNAFGEIVKAATQISGVIPQISIIDGACLGTSALMANMADVVVAVKDSDFYVTAPSDETVEQTAKQGGVDIVAEDFDVAVNEVKKLVALLPQNNLQGVGFSGECNQPSLVANDASSLEDIIASIADDDISVELKKDYAENVMTVLSCVQGCTTGIIGFKGASLCPSCCYKAEGFIKLCDAFNIPIITIANADGLKKDNEAQMLVALTKLTSAYSTATCPKISLVTSQSIGSAYITLAGKGANADFTLAWENAVASPLDVESAVAFLFNDRLANGEDRQLLEAEYKNTIGSAYSAAACGAVDDIFTPEETRTKICEYLGIIINKRETTIPRKHSVK